MKSLFIIRLKHKSNKNKIKNSRRRIDSEKVKKYIKMTVPIINNNYYNNINYLKIKTQNLYLTH